MAEFIPGPVHIPVPGGKSIEEYFGNATTGEDAISIALMNAPAGWEEPGQTPEFDEYTVVLEGLDAANKGQGSVKITDKSMTSGGAPLVTHYLYTDDGVKGHFSGCNGQPGAVGLAHFGGVGRQVQQALDGVPRSVHGTRLDQLCNGI